MLLKLWSLEPTLPVEDLQELFPCCLSTHWTTPEPGLLMMPRAKEVKDNSMVLLMSMSRLSSPMVSKDFTEVSSSLPLVSSSTVACTSASMTHSSQSSLERMLELLSLQDSCPTPLTLSEGG